MRLVAQIRLIALTCLCALSSATVEAQSVTTPIPERQRIERLSDLGRLWGHVKFLHPALADGVIDWDKALVDAIPKVRAALTAEAYRDAVHGMLAALGDPQTRAVHGKPKAPAQGPTRSTAVPTDRAAGPPVRTVDGMLVIDVAALTRLQLSGDQAGAERATEALAKEGQSAKGVVIDLRVSGEDSGYLRFFLRSMAPQIASMFLASPVTLATSRVRQSYGYVAATGMLLRGYETGLLTTSATILNPHAKAVGARPLAIVITAGSDDAIELAAGLQAAGLGRVIEESGVDRIDDAAGIPLSDGVVALVRYSDWMTADGHGFSPDVRVPAGRDGGKDAGIDAALAVLATPHAEMTRRPARSAAPIEAPDKPYADMTLPPLEYRLLALFRLWSVIDRFFPYFAYMDRPWGEALAEFIPRFEAAETSLDYQLAVLELAARTQDSHVSVRNAGAAQEYFGTHAPPLMLVSAEGEAVVAALPGAGSGTGVAVGDIILAVDGTAIEERRKLFARYIAASTPQALARSVEAGLLRGPKDRPARLTIRGSDGKTREVDVARTLEWVAARTELRHLPAHRKEPAVHAMLPSGYGYIDLERLKHTEADRALDALLAAPAIIFDMRGYPDGTAWVLGPRLVKQKPAKPIVAAHFFPPFWRGPHRFKLSFDQTLGPSDKPSYQGKVVMLIDEWAVSQAEHTCLFFSAATDVTFIGSATTGANGDVTNLVLPGNLIVQFTGQEVRWPDGRQLQRVGVKPHVEVRPTIAGIRAGQDEVLEAAIAYLDARKHK